jgi:hypothetical protein
VWEDKGDKGDKGDKEEKADVFALVNTLISLFVKNIPLKGKGNEGDKNLNSPIFKRCKIDYLDSGWR